MELSALKQGIIKILADGEFHSGTELSNALNVSRSAVWKQLSCLTELGIEYSAVSGKGYRLARPIELFNRTAIWNGLTGHSKQWLAELIIHNRIDSTNSYLNRLCQNQGDTPSGLLCLAEFQSAGKGRRGRYWVSPFGSNIYLSLLWRYQSGPAAISALSLAVGIAVIRALKKFGIDDVGLKWPNDIYWRGKKLGGILVEVAGEADGPCTVVIGLGLNIYVPAAEAEAITQQWTDLTQILGAAVPSRNALASAVINELVAVTHLFDRVGITAYLQEWRSYDCMPGAPVTLHMGNRQVAGIVQGIDNNGFLMLKHQDGTTGTYTSGEVSFKASVL